MALQSIGGVVYFPPAFGPFIDVTPPFLSTTYLIDAAGESSGCIMRAPKTGTISAVTFRTATVTTGATVDVRIETVDATTGLPSGTLFGTNTNGAQIILDANDNVLFTTALTAGASVTKGDLLAIVITTPAGGNMQITGVNTQPTPSAFPYGALFTAAWAKVTASLPMAGLQYNDGSYAFCPQTPVVSTLVSTTYGSGTNPNNRALRLQVPVPCRVTGAYVCADGDAAADLLLVADNWDGNNANALASLAIDPDIRRNTGVGTFQDYFSNTVTLTANTTYRLVLKPSSASTLSLSSYTVASAAQLDQNGANQQCYQSVANNPTGSGDWTPTTTARPLMGLLIDQFDDGIGLGSLIAGGLIAA